MSTPEPAPIGYSIKETPKAFTQEWGKNVERVLDINWKALLPTLKTEPGLGTGVEGHTFGDVEQANFGLADFLDLPADTLVAVQRYTNKKGHECYSFSDRNPKKATRRVEVEKTETDEEYVVTLSDDREPKKYNPSNINYARREMAIKVKAGEKTADYITDSRLVVNRNLMGRYEAKGISYLYACNGSRDSTPKGQIHAYIDQETEDLPHVEWNVIEPPETQSRNTLVNIDKMKDVVYPFNWLNQNLPQDKSIQKIPIQNFSTIR